MPLRSARGTRCLVQSDSVVQAIETLLNARGNSDLAAIERTLTDGYAKALSLEAERWRIQRRIGEVASTLGRGDVAAKTKEIVSLAQRLEAADRDLIALRNLLGPLRGRADAARAGAARAGAARAAIA